MLRQLLPGIDFANTSVSKDAVMRLIGDENYGHSSVSPSNNSIVYKDIGSIDSAVSEQKEEEEVEQNWSESLPGGDSMPRVGDAVNGLDVARIDRRSVPRTTLNATMMALFSICPSAK